jgi:LmbE family N-acetylglucosaminyl deacetylase
MLCILVFGAHPDDSDLRFGGSAMLFRGMGHQVKFISVTNGDTGHYAIGGGALARRRYEECQAAAAVADIEYEVFDIHNGELVPDIPTRKMVIRAIREYNPDVVVCHRACDYHPDHRAVGVLVQDAIYICRVPNMVALTEPLHHTPVLLYTHDGFSDPTPFRIDIAIDTDEVFERKADMVASHVSQMFEWGPWSGGNLDEVPEGEQERRDWLAERLRSRFGDTAEACRETLAKLYGDEHAEGVATAEAFMISEYGRKPTDEDIRELFPFLP